MPLQSKHQGIAAWTPLRGPRPECRPGEERKISHGAGLSRTQPSQAATYPETRIPFGCKRVERGAPHAQSYCRIILPRPMPIICSCICPI